MLPEPERAPADVFRAKFHKASYWRALCPSCHISRDGASRAAPLALADARVAELRARMDDDGYFQIDAAELGGAASSSSPPGEKCEGDEPGWGYAAVVARLGAAVETLAAAGWPPTLCCVYDEVGRELLSERGSSKTSQRVGWGGALHQRRELRLHFSLFCPSRAALPRRRHDLSRATPKRCGRRPTSAAPQAWALVRLLARVTAGGTDGNESIFDLVAWRIDAARGAAGFAPHRDRHLGADEGERGALLFRFRSTTQRKGESNRSESLSLARGSGASRH